MEMARLNAGANVILSVMAIQHPPVSLNVGEVPSPI